MLSNEHAKIEDYVHLGMAGGVSWGLQATGFMPIALG